MVDRFQLVLDLHCSTGESPVWLPAQQRLLFVDTPGRRLYQFDPHSQRLVSVAVDEDIGCVASARGGGFVAAMRSGGSQQIS